MATATPQRPLPGAFYNTPAAPRFGAPLPPPIFRPSALSSAQPRPQYTNPPDQPQQASQSRQDPQYRSLQPIARAARTINEVLQKDVNFPELDSYVRREYLPGPF